MALPLTHDAAQPFTFEDLDAIPDDGRRWELIAGALVVSPSPLGAHQWCVMRLAAALDADCPGDMMVIPSPYDWRVEATGESFQPDVMVIRRADFDPDGHMRATPLLVVEIVSPRAEARDRMLKRARYEALGVGAYWIVDPAKPSLTELRLFSGRYAERMTATGDYVLDIDYPFPVSLTAAALSWQG